MIETHARRRERERKDSTAVSPLTALKTMQINEQEIATMTIPIEAPGSSTKGLMNFFHGFVECLNKLAASWRLPIKTNNFLL